MNHDYAEAVLKLVLEELEERGVDLEIIGALSFDEIVEKMVTSSY
jgi:predicted acetyltransferase